MLGFSSTRRFGAAAASDWQPAYSKLEAASAANFATVEFRPAAAAKRATAGMAAGDDETAAVANRSAALPAGAGHPAVVVDLANIRAAPAGVAVDHRRQQRPASALIARLRCPRPVRRQAEKRRLIDPMVIAAATGGVVSRGAAIRRDKPRPVEQVTANRGGDHSQPRSMVDARLRFRSRPAQSAAHTSVAELEALVTARLAEPILIRRLEGAVSTAAAGTANPNLPPAGEFTKESAHLSALAGRMRELLGDQPSTPAQRRQGA